jgi:hypothetical protein
MPVAAAFAGMSWVASAVAFKGRAEAVRRVTIKKAKVLFITLEKIHLSYNRLFFFNTSTDALSRDSIQRPTPRCWAFPAHVVRI